LEPFDLLNVPLSGRNLIEANAGTGKTYAISGLFLRLVVERGLPVNEILVMTYTVAATEELKDRIRGMLRKALDALRRGPVDDPFLSSYRERLVAEGRTNSARRRLTAALRDFDEASIFTIHGFCQRTLQENAFESSSTFDAELITGSEKITERILQDFWRRHFYEAPPELVAYALITGNDLARYRAFLRHMTNYPDIRLVPDLADPDREQLDAEIESYRQAIRAVRKDWETCRETIQSLLQAGALKATSYGGAKTDRYLEELDAFLSSGPPWFPLPSFFEKFTPAKLASSCRKGCSPPDHPFFTACREAIDREAFLRETLERFLLSLKRELLEAVRVELPVYKSRRNILFFDDLLLRLRDALQQRSGDLLAESIRKKYRAALIDEFQDTDPVQYAILRAVFLRDSQQEAENPPVFLIGDPKQAIYSFRGADIFAYMAAARQADVAYTLKENWRSAPALLGAVNALFHNRPNPFVYEAICFADTTAAPGGRKERLSLSGLEGGADAPLQLWIVPAEEEGEGDGKPLAKGRVTPRILSAVTAEIARLLEAGMEGKARINHRGVEAGDVAVLVRSNREARLMHQALAGRNIPAVLHSRDNLFDAPDAADMECLLRAIEVPNDERRLGSALLTPLLGLSIGGLYHLKNDERQWEEWLQRFRNYHTLWQEDGFMRMIRSLLRVEDVRARLLSRADGERRLTNVLHLAEVLHRESLARSRGMRGLVRWLAEQRNPGKARFDEHQLRLESDAHAVRIVTIHKSKGMEYPIVFFPFAWEGANDDQPQNGAICHGGEDNQLLICDIGLPSRPLHGLRAYREGLAERVRLLYVALTRAKHRCYLVWGHFNRAESSAPAYLFHDRALRWEEADPEETAAAVEAARKSYKELPKPVFLSDLEQMAASASGAIHLETLPIHPTTRSLQRAVPEREMQCRKFTRELDRTWRFTSFSSLVFGQYPLPERADREGEEEAGPAEAPDWRNLPPGTPTGNLLHEFLEHLDFAEKNEGVLRERAKETLSAHGFDPRWETALVETVRNTLAMPLRGGEGRKTFRLSEVSRKDRISELGFYFPLKRLTREKLQGLFRYIAQEDPGSIPASWDIEIERLSFSPVHGWLRGFIDLVFAVDDRYYLVDWKSNNLGADPACYSPEALKTVMARKHYILQYHLYALALHAYLQRRLTGYRVERHFGGVYYLFLRGLNPIRGTESGIYFDRPSEARLTALYEALIEKNAAKGGNANAR